jgi:hypothetical protein
MPQLHSESPTAASLGRVECFNCGHVMTLTRIERDQPHHELRTFECCVCLHAESIVVKLA